MLLAKLVKKIPMGVNGRWEKIAKAMGRTPYEVALQASLISKKIRPLGQHGPQASKK